MTRSRVETGFKTGVRAIDIFSPLCLGQRLGIFAGSGVGKSVLIEMMARFTVADVVVVGLIGERAREVGVERIFCLTFETDFFSRHGFVEIQGTPVDPAVYQELLLSYDAGIAEFLELESVKPNTLGNTRMLKILT